MTKCDWRTGSSELGLVDTSLVGTRPLPGRRGSSTEGAPHSLSAVRGCGLRAWRARVKLVPGGGGLEAGGVAGAWAANPRLGP